MTFEELIDRATRQGLLRMLNCAKRVDGKGYEASIKRPDHDAYGVNVAATPHEAIAGLLLEPGDSYDERDDSLKSYEAALAAKKARGDTHDWEKRAARDIDDLI